LDDTRGRRVKRRMLSCRFLKMSDPNFLLAFGAFTL
jgi:hypothetical protein